MYYNQHAASQLAVKVGHISVHVQEDSGLYEDTETTDKQDTLATKTDSENKNTTYETPGEFETIESTYQALDDQ